MVGSLIVSWGWDVCLHFRILNLRESIFFPFRSFKRFFHFWLLVASQVSEGEIPLNVWETVGVEVCVCPLGNGLNFGMPGISFSVLHLDVRVVFFPVADTQTMFFFLACIVI